jgi:predicted transcriptional regulator
MGASLWIVFVVTRKGLLELDSRRRLYEFVTKFPGLHLREIARGVELDPNHAKYHLQYLEKHDLVSSRRQDGYWTFWPRHDEGGATQEAVDRRDKDILAFLRRPVPLHIVLLLLDRPDLNQVDMLEHVGVGQSTLHYHLKKLEAAGVLVSQRPGRERVYQLLEPERLLGLLMRFRPPDSLVQGFLEAWEQLELE